MAKGKAAKREKIKPKGDTRYVRREGAGKFNESVDASRSLSQGRKKRAKRAVRSGQGDRDDRKTK